MPHHPSPTAMARDASASCSVVEPPPRPPADLGASSAVPYVANATVRSRGPVMGCIACAAAHPDKAPRRVNTTYSRLLEGRCAFLLAPSGPYSPVLVSSRSDR